MPNGQRIWVPACYGPNPTTADLRCSTAAGLLDQPLSECLMTAEVILVAHPDWTLRARLRPSGWFDAFGRPLLVAVLMGGVVAAQPGAPPVFTGVAIGVAACILAALCLGAVRRKDPGAFSMLSDLETRGRDRPDGRS